MHFTYSPAEPSPDLSQGDLLFRTPALEEVLKNFHSYYNLKPDYIGFLILTQTCDLVRSNRDLRADYITMCAVRPIEAAIKKERKRQQNSYILKHGDAVTDRGYNAMRMFLERLLNNNEEEYFYIHPDPSFGTSDKLCAFIRLSVAIKAEHYESCLLSRKASLTPEFQAKLGWHIGKLFNRVATEDWSPATELKKIIKEILDENVVRMDEKKVKEAEKAVAENAVLEMSETEIREFVSAIEVPKKKDQLVDAITEALSDANLVSADRIEKARNLLISNPTLSALVKG